MSNFLFRFNLKFESPLLFDISNHFRIQTLKILFKLEQNHKTHYLPKLNGNMSTDINKIKIYLFEVATQKNLREVEFLFVKNNNLFIELSKMQFFVKFNFEPF